MGFGDFSVIGLAVMFTFLGAFLVFLGLYVLMIKSRGSKSRRRFARKQMLMEKALNNKIKNKEEQRNMSEQALESRHRTRLERQEETTQIEEAPSRTQLNREYNPIMQEKKASGSLWSDTKYDTVQPGREISKKRYALREKKRAAVPFQEERRISHRRDQLKQLGEREVCSRNIDYPME